MVNVNFEEHFEFLLLLFSLTEVPKKRHGRRHWSRKRRTISIASRRTISTASRRTISTASRRTISTPSLKYKTRILRLDSKASRLFSFPVKKTVPTRNQAFWIWQWWRPSRGISCYLPLASSLEFSIRNWHEHSPHPISNVYCQSLTIEHFMIRIEDSKASPRTKGNTLSS